MQLDRDFWLAERAFHQSVISPWVQPRLDRKSRQEKHPVDDFLFEYYPISPGKVLAWHPGFGVQLDALPDDVEFFSSKFYELVDGKISLRNSYVETTYEAAMKAIEFLELTRGRPAVNGCFGLHEWAMVLGQDVVRHDSWNLRLSQSAIRATIDEVGLRCTHFDAFRFFTDEARPLNPTQLTRADQIHKEQPGCLHANMDLYRTVFNFAPILGSELLREAFALARDIRTVDMQVAPYDLVELGLQPIRVETSAGRAEFASRQREFSERANQIRLTVIAGLNNVYASSGPISR